MPETNAAQVMDEFIRFKNGSTKFRDEVIVQLAKLQLEVEALHAALAAQERPIPKQKMERFRSDANLRLNSAVTELRRKFGPL